MSAIVKGLTDLQFHDATNIFRMLDNGDFESLVEDVRKNGLREPIKLLDGKIIDGRNRYKACLLAGVEAVFRSIETYDPVAYVMSLNQHRRHDNKSELGLAAARAKEYYEKEAKERQQIRKGEQAGSSKENLPELDKGQARDKAGDAFGVSGKTVDHGVAVLTKGVPELEDAVVGKKVSISKAAAIAQETPEKQKEILEDPKKLKDFKKDVAVQPKELNPKEPASVVELVSLSDALRAATRKTSVTAEYLAKRTGIAQSKIQAWLDLSEQANGFKAVKQSDGSFAIHRQKIKSDRQFVASVKSQSIHGDATPVEHLASDLDCIAMKIEGVLRTYGESCKDVSAWKQIGDDDRKNLLAMLCSVQAKVDLYFPEFITRVFE